MVKPCSRCFFFFNEPATTEIYPLSLHDALPIFWRSPARPPSPARPAAARRRRRVGSDRKSTRLNSSHGSNSYAVICLQKKTRPLVAAPPLSQHLHQPDFRPFVVSHAL